jgi:TRAP-type C4-dicarboxylate transport system permease small subunit
MRSLKENLQAVVDLSVVLMIVIAFAGLMVIGYIIWTVRGQLTGPSSDANTTLDEITGGFDDAIGLILVAITIFVLAIAISALLMLRGRQ